MNARPMSVWSISCKFSPLTTGEIAENILKIFIFYKFIYNIVLACFIPIVESELPNKNFNFIFLLIAEIPKSPTTNMNIADYS